MDIFRAAMILKSLHMLKGSDMISDELIIKKLSENFRIQKSDTESNIQFYQRFVQDFGNGKYTAYLCGRELRRAFYASPEWQSLKKRVMNEHEHKCVACGTSKNLSVDHIVSRHKDASLSLEYSNCQILCLDCNMKKSWR